MKTIKLKAPLDDIYISCSITGLSKGQAEKVAELGRSVVFLCKQLGFSSFFPYDYVDDEMDENGVRFSDEEVRERLKRVTKTARLFIMIVSSKSYGVGTECEMVDAALIPMILVRVNGDGITEMIVGSKLLRANLDVNSNNFDEQFTQAVIKYILRENLLQKLWRAMRASYQEFCYIVRRKE